MDIQQKIYKYLIYYPMTVIRGYNLPNELRKYLISQYFERTDMESIQFKKFKKLISYAKNNVPYYNKIYKNINVSQLSNLGEIEEVPFITKINIKENYNLFQSNKNLHFNTKKTTGGSTGQPVTIWKSAESISKELAAMWRCYSWAGIKIGDKQARFWGIPFTSKDRIRSKIIDLVSNRRRFSAFSFDEKNLMKYHLELNKFKPDYFYGYLSMLVEYAKFINKNGYHIDFNLKGIITTSEVLTLTHRHLLEKTFSAKVHNEYGCGEVGSIAHECEKGSMHVMAENILLEIFDGNRKCGFNEDGEVVVTELNNYAMPLIRYRLGDYARLSSLECPCGIKLPVISNIYGRAYDIIKNHQGMLFHGEFFMYMFEDAQKIGIGVEKFQIKQLDYRKFLIKIIPGAKYSKETEIFIDKRFKNDFDKESELIFQIVDTIPREKSGKMRVIIGMDDK